MDQYNRIIKNKGKNAIFMMCIINETYVIGACIAVYCHRKMLEKYDLKDNIDLVLMCDENIYDKYSNLLRCNILFDRIEKINLRIFQDAAKYDYAKLKYSSWIGASLNKWQILKYDEYDKIMFVDIALIPSDPQLYELFDKKVPAFYMRSDREGNRDITTKEDCTDGQIIKFDRDSEISFDQYLGNTKKYGTTHGNLIILKPNKELNDKYETLTDELYKDGIYSIYESGPDETSIFYFYMKQGITVHDICHENATIPWDEPYLVNISKGYEFSSMYKPWVKPKILCWPEETLWSDIYKIIIKELNKINTEINGSLQGLYKTTIINTYVQYMSSNKKTQQRNYNDKYIKRFSKEFDKLKDATNNDDLFEEIMNIDSKIYVKYYGQLRTNKLTQVL
jgi:hypothetical protein